MLYEYGDRAKWTNDATVLIIKHVEDASIS